MSKGRPRTSKRILVEECCHVLSNKALKGTAQDVTSVTVTTQNPQQTLTATIMLTRSTLNYGGQRNWFLCPECNRRSGRLYLHLPTDERFRCRVCINGFYPKSYRDGFWGGVVRTVCKVEERRYGTDIQC